MEHVGSHNVRHSHISFACKKSMLLKYAYQYCTLLFISFIRKNTGYFFCLFWKIVVLEQKLLNLYFWIWGGVSVWSLNIYLSNNYLLNHFSIKYVDYLLLFIVTWLIMIYCTFQMNIIWGFRFSEINLLLNSKSFLLSHSFFFLQSMLLRK